MLFSEKIDTVEKVPQLLSFKYNKKDLSEIEFDKQIKFTKSGFEQIIALKDGLKIKTVCRYFEKYNAYEWTNYFLNDSDKESGIVSELYDCGCELPMPHDDDRVNTANMATEEESIMIYSPSGSTWVAEEFYDNPYKFRDGNKLNGMYFPGERFKTSASGGRSSEKQAPFFNIRKGNMGYVVAVGWTGQWEFGVQRKNDSVVLSSGIEDTNFKLLPHEEFRTSSVVILRYEGDFIDGQNSWRRLVKDEYSMVGEGKRVQYAPFCLGLWGGMSTEGIIERVKISDKYNIPFDVVWLDAGWYGAGTQKCTDVFSGDWAEHTGDWRVNTNNHPDGLTDVSKAIHDSGRKFLLWAEPERVRPKVPDVSEHPEHYLKCEGKEDLLLNLGDTDAWNYCFDTLSGLIERLGIDVYRQDFNMPPLDFWKANDADDRRGISEIKHINGLYRLWDMLLTKFPNLMIDNCASGGRRLDIEMQRRSFSLWRSDSQCPDDVDAYVTQCHSQTFPLWTVYAGTTGGTWLDTYGIRSAFGPSLHFDCLSTEKKPFEDNAENFKWLKAISEEYIKVRPYTTCDFYPLTEFSTCNDVWFAVQYNRPENDDGIVLAFRRPNANCKYGVFELRGLCEGDYSFTDADTGEEFILNGSMLDVIIENKRESKLFFYKKLIRSETNDG